MENRIIKSPTLRRYGYLVMVAVVALLIGYGIIEEGMGDLWKELIYAVFGIGFGVAAVNTPEKHSNEQEDEITTLIEDE